MISRPKPSKQELRQYCLAYLKSIPHRAVKEDLICNRMSAQIKEIAAHRILSYYPLKNEVDITRLNLKLNDMGKEVFLPFFHKQGIGRYSNTLHYDNKLAAYEPVTPVQKVDLDLVIIPGLAFDEKGYRLGRGQGWYDRFLNSQTALKLAVCFDELVFKELPHESHDIKVDIVITPQKILSMNRL